MRKLIIASLIFSFLVSCKKDKKCNLDTASVSGSYKVTAVRYKATPSGAESDYYTQFFPDACERDDIITLNANGTYVFTDAGVKCSPPGDDNGSWSLSGNTLLIDGSPENIDEFKCSTLTLSEVDVFALGDKITIVLTRQ